MYQQYLETNDPEALVAISQELDQAINMLYLSKTTKVTWDKLVSQLLWSLLSRCFIKKNFTFESFYKWQFI